MNGFRDIHKDRSCTWLVYDWDASKMAAEWTDLPYRDFVYIHVAQCCQHELSKVHMFSLLRVECN